MTKTAFVSQGASADLIATMGGYSRDDVDAFALGSQRKAAAARGAGHFSRSVVAVRDSSGQVVLAQDEVIKPSTTRAALGSLNPPFANLGARGLAAVCAAERRQVGKEWGRT